MSQIPKLSWKELSEKYCERQVSIPEELLGLLRIKESVFKPKGFMLLECQDMCSSLMGSLTILPYGGETNTFKTIPDYPISPRGRANDTSVVIGFLPVEDLPNET